MRHAFVAFWMLAPSVAWAVSTPVSVEPLGAGAAGQTFEFTFADNTGSQNLGVANVLINNSLDGRHACFVAFVPSGPSGGSVFLVDDAGDAGGPYQGLVLPAASGTVQNG